MQHVIAAKAVAFKEALDPSFSAYAHRIVENARALAASLEENGLRIVSGGTDNHSMLVDLTAKNVTGKDAEKGLDRAFLTCNKNGIPYDTRSPFVTSGIRLGTPAGTTRGFGAAEFKEVGALINEVLDGLAKNLRLGDDGRYRWHWDPAFMSEDRRPRTTTHSELFTELTRKLALPVLLVREPEGRS